MFKNFFERSEGNPEILKAILKLNYAMLTNKCQRLSGTKNSHKVYYLIQYLMPYWMSLLERFTSEETCSINLQLYRIFNCIAKEGHVNFYLLMRVVSCYDSYIYNLLRNMNNISGWVSQYPKLIKAFKESMKLLCVNLPEVILSNTNKEITLEFHNIICYFIKLNMDQMNAYLDGNKSKE